MIQDGWLSEMTQMEFWRYLHGGSNFLLELFQIRRNPSKCHEKPQTTVAQDWGLRCGSGRFPGRMLTDVVYPAISSITTPSFGPQNHTAEPPSMQFAPHRLTKMIFNGSRSLVPCWKASNRIMDVRNELSQLPLSLRLRYATKMVCY